MGLRWLCGDCAGPEKTAAIILDGNSQIRFHKSRLTKEAVKTIPVIGNGDIITPQAAKKMLDETGCAGVSIGRGAFYDPWIFQRTLQCLKNQNGWGETPSSPDISNNPRRILGSTESRPTILPEPSFTERVRVMCRHLDLMIEIFGEELGCRMFRKVAPWHAKRFGPCREFNKRVVQISTRAEFDGVLENYIRWRRQFLDETGELQPRFCPPPMVASFMRDPACGDEAARRPASTRREQIPVPKGPVEVW